MVITSVRLQFSIWFVILFGLANAQTPVLDSLWQTYRAAADDTTAIMQLSKLGQAYHAYDPDSSLLLSTMALQRAQATGYTRGEADAWVSRAAYYYVNSSFDTALTYINQGLDIYRAINDQSGTYRALNNRAGIYFRQGHYDEAISDLQQLYQHAILTDNQKRVAGLLNNIGILQKARGERVRALGTLLEALQLRLEINDTISIGLTYQSLGNLYSELQQYDRADEMYRKALAQNNTQGNRLIQVYILYNVGKLLVEKGALDSALVVFQEGLDLATQLDLPIDQANARVAIANIHRDRGLFELATQLYRAGIRTYRAQEDKPGLSEALVDYATLEYQQGRYDRAREMGSEAFTLAHEIGNPKACLDASDFMAKLSEEDQRPAAALFYLKEANFWRDSLESSQIALQVQEVQMRYELQLAERENQLALLEKEKELQATTSYLQRRWLIFLIGAILVVSLLGIVLYRLYRQKQAINRQLADNVEQLNENKQQLEGANFNLGATVQQLKLTNNKLEQFAFAASHDLKESVRSITSFSQLLVRQTPANQRRQHEYLDYIVNGGRRMQKTLNNLLQYNNLTYETKLENYVDTDAVLNMVLSTLQKNPNYPALTLTRDQLPPLGAERLQLEQLYYNLIENALFYRRPGEPLLVHVGIDRTDEADVFFVRDNGIGVDKKYLDNIFEPFFRLHDRNRSGSGLGLAICRRIVEIYEGRIWAELPENGGMLIQFTLPQARKRDETPAPDQTPATVSE